MDLRWPASRAEIARIQSERKRPYLANDYGTVDLCAECVEAEKYYCRLCEGVYDDSHPCDAQVAEIAAEPCLCGGRGCSNCDDEIWERGQELLREERAERRRYYSDGYEAGYNDGSDGR